MCSNANKRILFVEDDEDDRFFILETFGRVSNNVELVFAENGLKAMQYLNEIGNHPDNTPCLIVLDLNMPLMDGRQTFHKIKNELKLGEIPIMIFTSSLNPADKQMFNQLGVEFISKPDDFRLMGKVASRMIEVCG